MEEKKITIDPITRLEGHGKIDIFLNDDGNVDRAYYQIPELRGFEVFCKGRPAEEMPQITSRICGVCPTAHHMAATKTLDSLYQTEPPEAARKIRELLYHSFMVEDHALHIYFLSGPDFIVGPDTPKQKRNLIGVVEQVGVEKAKYIISMRRKLREFISSVGGKITHPVFGLPGGVAQGISSAQQNDIKKLAEEGLEFAKFTRDVFNDLVLANDSYVEMITSEAYSHQTYYMSLVDKDNRLNFYDGDLRVVDQSGEEYVKFPVEDYYNQIAEQPQPWCYVRFPYLKKIGWKGFVDGPDSGILAVAPLARLNASEGLTTPEAQKEYEKYFDALGGKPVHYTLANHWARVIEMLYAAERFYELSQDQQITSDQIRNIPDNVPDIGYGVVEAPRGTLFHHYETDEKGKLEKVNLIVATQNNSGRIAMSVEKAAKALIKNGEADEGLLNQIEMAFRAYDPCNACATHAMPGEADLVLNLRDKSGTLVNKISRYSVDT